MTHIVKITKEAMFGILNAGIEAYLVKHESKNVVAIETAGYLWGNVSKALPFKCEMKHFTLESSAKRYRDQVHLDSVSLLLKEKVSYIFGNGYQLIGDFHTHPYTPADWNTRDIRKKKLFGPSPWDHESAMRPGLIKIGKHQYTVSVILTLLKIDKANTKMDGKSPFAYVQEFSLGNIKLWLSVQVYKICSARTLSAQQRIDFEQFGLEFENHDICEVLALPVDTTLETSFEFEQFNVPFGRVAIQEDEFGEESYADYKPAI